MFNMDGHSFHQRRFMREMNVAVPYDSFVTLKNWLPLNLLKFSSKLSELFDVEVVHDFHLERDREFFQEWKGNKDVHRWCVLINNIAVGISDDKILVSQIKTN